MPPKKKKTAAEQKSQTTVPTEEQKFGALTANTLLAEINPPGMGFSTKDDDLMDKPPERKDLSFVIKDGEDFAKIELNLFDDNDTTGIKKYGVNAICLSSGFVGEKGLFDIDHVFPIKIIEEKQKKLLKYLKNNEKFAKAFMGEEPLNPGLKDKIGKYFSRDPKTHEIKGKWRFFRACYNDKDNLILLSRNINSSKSAKTLEEWIKEQKILGSDCKQALEAKGGAHDGVILQKVFKPEFTDKVGKQKIKTINIGGNEIFLHGELKESQIIGAGAFINEWCSENRGEYIEFCKQAYEDVISRIKKVIDSTLDNNKKIPQIEKMLVSLVATEKTLETLCGINEDGTERGRSASAADTPNQKARRASSQSNFTVMANHYMHEMKKIQMAIELDPNVNAKEAKSLLNTFDNLNIGKLSVDDRRNFFINLSKKLGILTSDGKENKLANIQLSVIEIESKMKQAEKESNSAKIAEAAEAKAAEEKLAKEAAEAKAAEEKLAKEAAKAKAAEEKLAKEAAEARADATARENAELKARLAAFQAEQSKQQQMLYSIEEHKPPIGADGGTLSPAKSGSSLNERVKDMQERGVKRPREARQPTPRKPHN